MTAARSIGDLVGPAKPHSSVTSHGPQVMPFPRLSARRCHTALPARGSQPIREVCFAECVPRQPLSGRASRHVHPKSSPVKQACSPHRSTMGQGRKALINGSMPTGRLQFQAGSPGRLCTVHSAGLCLKLCSRLAWISTFSSAPLTYIT